MFWINKDGTYSVRSRTSDTVYIVDANVTRCSCPKFKFILKGQGSCHHMDEIPDKKKEVSRVTPVEENKAEWKSDKYTHPLLDHEFVDKYGDSALDHLLETNQVIIMNNRVRKLE